MIYGLGYHPNVSGALCHHITTPQWPASDGGSRCGCGCGCEQQQQRSSSSSSQPGAYDGRTPCAALLPAWGLRWQTPCASLLPGLAIAMPLMKLHLKQRAAQGLMSAKLLCSIMMQVTQRSQAGF